ncbi:MAG: Rpn family recombination-promoting nuclease/putative transposase [Prevotellaceae bacterium]|nr:Rpn family recombination-promoting nuclease/putative transposase [Prevotellaceae bacterium]
MEANNKYIRFDWAIKRILRDKANFAVLEGFITVLLGERIKIREILESEGNQNDETDKFNRVDIKAVNSKDEIIIVEVQLTRQLYYLQRMLYGVSKAITEHIHIGEKYDNVKKVYSINVLYFDLGQGSDYLYHGKTVFKGVHTGDYLKVNTKEDAELRMRTPDEVFPEYFLIRVNQFNDVAKTPIEEWLDYLKNNRIREDTTTPGLQEAKQKLLYMTMNESDRRAYDVHMDNLMVQNDVLDTAKREGRAEGREQGRAEGRAEAVSDMVRNMKMAGLSTEDIQRFTNLSKEEIERIK